MPQCKTCEHWDDTFSQFYGDEDVGLCSRMTQSSPQLMRAQESPDGDGQCDVGIAYPSDKRANLLTHADFGCILHSSIDAE